LEDEIFSVWKQQVLSNIRGFKLEPFVMGLDVPVQFSPSNDASNSTYGRYYI